MTFPVPSWAEFENGKKPVIDVKRLDAFNCTSAAPNEYKYGLDAQLARRDLNVVPTFLPNSFNSDTALPGALILSGVFQQDGSDAPFLQPIVHSFMMQDIILPGQPPDNPTHSFSVQTFFQLYNNYSCANIQLFSAEDKAIYNVLLGGVSYFFSGTKDGRTST